MKTETIYVILTVQGQASVLKGPGFRKVDLNQLLADGWRPIRETPFGESSSILIRLEREPEGQMGFGFGH